MYKLNGNIWVEKEGKKYIYGRNIELLEQIDKLGSIFAAANYLGMGYRTAWLKVEEMNELAPRPLVVKKHGGVGGGNTILTAEGKKVINEYKKTVIQFYNFLDMLSKKNTLL
jgi:molybdate transport system regulatory protein